MRGYFCRPSRTKCKVALRSITCWLIRMYHDHNTCLYYDHNSTCMYDDHTTTMYEDLRICMCCDLSTCIHYDYLLQGIEFSVPIKVYTSKRWEVDAENSERLQDLALSAPKIIYNCINVHRQCFTYLATERSKERVQKIVTIENRWRMAYCKAAKPLSKNASMTREVAQRGTKSAASLHAKESGMQSIRAW